MGEDHPLGLQRQEPGGGVPRLGAASVQQHAQIGRRLAVGRGDPQEPGRAAPHLGQAPRLDVLHQVGQDQAARRPVEEGDLGEGAALHQHLLDLARPGLRRLLGKVMVDPQARLLHLAAFAQARSGPGGRGRIGVLPVRQEHPVPEARRHQMADRPELVDLGRERRTELRRRMQHEVARLQADDGHPDRHRRAARPDRLAVDHPDPLGHGLQLVDRRIGAGIGAGVGLGRHRGHIGARAVGAGTCASGMPA